MIGFLGIGKHHRVRGLLSAYIDGQVSETESRRVEKHLDLCDECRLELDTLRSTVDLLNRLPDLAVPRSFALSEAPAPVVFSPPFASAARLFAPVAAAVLVMLVVGDALGLVSQGGLGEQPASLTAESRVAVSGGAEPAPVAEMAAEVETITEVEVQKEVAVAVEKTVEVETTMEVEVVKEVAVEKAVEVVRETEVQKEVPIVVEKAIEVEGIAEVEVQKEVPVAAVEAVAVAEPEEADEAVEEPGPRRSADAPAASRELPPPAEEPAEAKEPVVVAVQEVGPTAAVVAESVEQMAAEPPDASESVEESDGLGLPLWQIEVAVGGLLAVLLAIAFRGWRRTGRKAG